MTGVHAPNAACFCCGGFAGQTGGSPPKCIGCIGCNPGRGIHSATHARPREQLETYVGSGGYIAWRIPSGQLALDLGATS